MRWLLPLLVLSGVSSAQTVEEWVHDKVQAQRGIPRAAPLAPVGPNGQLWREHPTHTNPIPQFTPPSSLAPLVKAVRPAVVNIATRNEGTSQSLGSGFLINPDGLVVTNNHVVERARRIQVRLDDGREFEASVAGRDPATDLALLRLSEAKNLPTAALADSDQIEVGDWVVAIGNPLGLESSVTFGLISARERVLGVGPYDEFIQTNALINPGNSGGPLFDMHGDVVGVNTLMGTGQRNQGISFAVPINMLKDLLPNLLANGRPERGWLGMSVQETGEGAARTPVVVEVYAQSPAEKAGLRPGDRVTAIGGKPVSRYQQILRRVALLSPGATVKIDVVRGGRGFSFTATLAARPSQDTFDALAADSQIAALGISVSVLDPNAAAALGLEPGLRVQVVLPGSPAETAGLSPGDVIIEANREPVSTLKDLQAATAPVGPGDDVVLLKVRRGSSSRYLAIKPSR